MTGSEDPEGKRGLAAVLGRLAVALVVAACLLLAALWWLSRPTPPDSFYANQPDPVPPPGTLIATDPFTREVPDGARAWRILYATTRADDSPAVASGVVMASGGGGTGRPVVAWAHGTTGVAPGCAPSVMEHPFENVPALRQMLDQGWVYVATDYAGLGTQAGGHAYLIGDDAARAVLDSVRAARQIEGLGANGRVVVWGHSQGGNSALWAGIRAPGYAPDLSVTGIAALAPATDLRALVEAARATMFGKIVSAFVMGSYAAAYPDVRAGDYLGPRARLLAKDMASRCVGGSKTLFSVAETMLLPRNMFTRDPASGPLGARLRENTPNRPIAIPVLIAQGGNDDIVRPAIQQAYVEDRCAAGQAIDFRLYRDRDHLSLVASGSPLEPELIAWTRERLNGAAPTPTCGRRPGAQPDTQRGEP